MHTASFMMTATHFFYETLQLPPQTDRFKDSSFKERACICQRSKFFPLCRRSQLLCQLCKKRHCRGWNLHSESDDNNFENALDRTIIQSSDENETPPTCTPPPSPLRQRRRPSPTPSPALGARPGTRKQSNKDGENLGKLYDQPFPRERKKYERKKK
jgi:hypothetical protein